MKGRFRRLKYLDVNDLTWDPKYIIACCILHNSCIDNNDLMEIDPIQVEQKIYEVIDIDRIAQQLAGHNKRNHICNQLFNNE